MVVWIVRDCNGWTYVSATRRQALNFIEGAQLTVVDFENQWQELDEHTCTIERADSYYDGA